MSDIGKYIGPDPVVWVERLMEINSGSSFTAEQKSIITRALNALCQQLESVHGHQE